ncbi:MAG: TonB-dependent receptor [Bacteroidales bacterium]|nr:TonB-dependent receptor [Bacteroidales bacterium]
MRIQLVLLLGFIGISLSGIGQEKKTDANIVGHVKCGETHLPFVTILVKGTSIGTTTDETGHFQLINLPVGKHTIRAQFLGYASQDKEVMIHERQTKEVNFSLQEDALGLEEVIVTGDKRTKSRKESVVLVNTLSPKLFSTTQSVTLSEGLNFSPGLRMENDCQNCGFNQVRMNGMEGAYSQILIDGRPVFGGLAAVYGLEMIPANMIKRVEVVKGGGSVLYGSNAIAGTINLILQEPVKNSYEFGVGSGAIGLGLKDSGTPAMDFTVNMNGSVVSGDQKSGLNLFAFYRNRQPFDVNDDSYSELALLKNLTAGTRLYHRFGERSKLTADFFAIHEKRRGGDQFDVLPHEANIAEAVEHTFLNGGVALDSYFREADVLSVYASGQYVNRDSYYGANQSLKDYGHTTQFNWAAGVQYLAKFGKSSLITGIDDQGSILKDTKLGYPDIDNAIIVNDSVISVPHVGNTQLANQIMNTIGAFAQYELKWKIMTFSAGLRLDHYSIWDHEEMTLTNQNLVLVPRIGLLVNITPSLQGRISYSQGYRAPQIFDEDLHIESSGSRRVIHVNDPDLKQETSHSIMASLGFTRMVGKVGLDIRLEGFYTLLVNPFTMEFNPPDSAGTVLYIRENASSGAFVAGGTLEVNVALAPRMTITSGLTWQQSRYEEIQEFGEKRFLRTPDAYGYLTFEWTPMQQFGISSTLNYTGPMLVPYFGPDQADPETGELRTSGDFFDWAVKLSYTIPLNGTSLQIYAGMKNILNSYQKDFDRGIDRDPGYIYGPGLPRTLYAGISFGNLLK